MAKKGVVFGLSLSGLLILVILAYAGWNHADPERSCASCHEIVPAMEIWQESAHRDIRCTECHGTAMGSLHSLREKSRMLFTHLRKDEREIRPGLDEEGVLRVMDACTGCHRDEHRAWKASGHAASYADIFLNEDHNHKERLYPDCFRCHGMYYDGGIADLVAPIDTEGPWRLLDDREETPVIPCLACHPIHMENEPRVHPGTMDDPRATFYAREVRLPRAGLYVRAERAHLRVDHLPQPGMVLGDREVLVSEDPLQRLCMQCHAPNWAHQAGTEDDRTPTGVHEGISCRACHRDHSNDPTNACTTCHPAVTSCNLDVREMNSSYRDRNSPHNIHSMTCADCHDPVPEASVP
jgi:hypothetical protein